MQPENKSFFETYKKQIIILIIAGILFFIIFYYFIGSNNSSVAGKGGSIISQGGGVSLYSKSNTTNQNSNDNSQNTTNDQNISYYKEGLIKIWDKPVAGYGFYYKNTPYTYLDGNGKEIKANRNDTILVFVDSNTGSLYQKNLSESTSTPTQITNSSFSNIRQAYFLNIGKQNKIILQYSANNTIKTILADIPDFYGSPTNLQNINSLNNNINNVSISSDFSKAVFTVIRNKNNNNKKDVYSDWYKIDINGVNKIYTSDLSSFKLQINNSGEIYAFNSETSTEKSNLYKLVNGSLDKIYTGHTGSSYLIGDNYLLASMFTGGNVLRIYEDQNFYGSNFEDNNLSELSFKTLTNKCSSGTVFICGVPKEIKNYDSGLPDAWYQGLTSWQDNLYIVNSTYPNGVLLFDLNNDGGVNDSFDIKNVKINKNNSHVLFTNKNDGSLWSLNIDYILNTGD